MEREMKCPICGTVNELTSYSEPFGEVERYYDCSHCGFHEEFSYGAYRRGVDTAHADEDYWPGDVVLGCGHGLTVMAGSKSSPAKSAIPST